MKWASRRKATRIEDEAYCLLGLFNVNMPLLYGEGQRAFRRLQIELIKDSTDESIFACDGGAGLLADSPRRFSYNCIEQSSWDLRKHYEFTNLGVHFTVPICRPHRRNTVSTNVDTWLRLEDRLILLFPLNCNMRHQTESGDTIYGRVGLLLKLRLLDPDLKHLRAVNGYNKLCIFKENSPGQANDDDEIIPRRRSGRPLDGEWVVMDTDKRAAFNLIVGRASTGFSEEYSLYVQT